MTPFFIFVVAPLLADMFSEVVASEEDLSKEVKTVEFRWIESRFIEGVTEKQPRSISPCDKESWYLHWNPALTTDDFAEVTLKKTLVAGGGVVGRQYYVSYKLKSSAIEKLVKQCGAESRKRIVAVYVKYKGKNADIQPSPIKYFPATTFDKQKPDAFHTPMFGYTPSKELANQVIQASR